MSPVKQVNVASHSVVCCGCAQQCGIVVDVTNNRVVDIRGDRNHPISTGFICPKGKEATDLVYHRQRLLTPRKRVGPRGGGRWVEIDWDTALDEIANRITHITSLHGPRALAYSYGTFRGGDWGIGERFMNRFGSPNACGQDKICLGPLTLAEVLTYGMGPTVFSTPMAGTTRCIVVWGMRPAASAPLLWRAICKAHQAGASLIVIDPERTREAARADLWLQAAPGRDAELALALMKILVANDLIEHNFVREHTLGFEDLRAHLASFNLTDLAHACEVPVERIEQAARLMGELRPMVINAGNGLCQSGAPSVQIGRAIACLIAVTGNLGVVGGHAMGGPPRDLRANGAMLDAGLLSESARAERLGAEHYAYLGAGYAAVDEMIAQAWYGHRHTLSWLATAHEPSLWCAIEEELPYAVKALIVQDHNPLGANPNAAAVARALKSEHLELSVVHDLFMTPTAELADYVLPAAHWLEKPYLSFGLGFMGAFGDYVGANAAVVAPPAQVCSDYEFWRDLGKRLGQAKEWPDRAEDFYTQCLAPAGLDFKTVTAAQGPLCGASARHPTHADEGAPALKIGTPSGKVELSSSLLAAWGLPALPTAVRPALDSQTSDYPLNLTTGGRSIEAFHENAQHMSRFRRKHPHPVATLHPATARRAGIREGDWLTIETPRGAIHQVAHLSDTLSERVVRADRWWYPEGTGEVADPYGLWATNINVCTSDAVADNDPVMGTWLMRGLPCRIVKYQG